MRKSTTLTNFCNPKIPGLGHRQSLDSRLAKTAGILGSSFRGLGWVIAVSFYSQVCVTKTRSPAIARIADRTCCQQPSRSSKVNDSHVI